MKWMTYDEVENTADYSRKPYEIDFDTNEERKYKEPYDGVRVYENGVIRVFNHGSYNPSWRGTMRDKFGVEFLYPKELTGRKFVDPDSGRAVPKTLLPTDLVYHDIERGRVYHVDNGAGLSFVSEHAQPSCKTFTYRVVNEERYRARMEELNPHIQAGQAFISLGDEHPGPWLDYYTKQMVAEGGVPDRSEPEKYKARCMRLASAAGDVVSIVRQVTKDVHHPQYLLVKET